MSRTSTDRWRRHQDTERRTHRQLRDQITSEVTASSSECVCGKPIVYHTLKEAQGTVRHFCSRECRNKRSAVTTQ